MSGFEHQALFAEGALPVLCATTGLAQGVNLPARLVVLMNTAKYSSAAGGYEEYTRIETMQMAGRAGRPQFDDQGVCVVMTREGMREIERWERFGQTDCIAGVALTFEQAVSGFVVDEAKKKQAEAQSTEGEQDDAKSSE